MTRREYREQLFEAYNNGRISAEAYDVGLMNEDDFELEDDEDLEATEQDELINEDEIIEAYAAKCEEEYQASLEEEE